MNEIPLSTCERKVFESLWRTCYRGPPTNRNVFLASLRESLSLQLPGLPADFRRHIEALGNWTIQRLRAASGELAEGESVAPHVIGASVFGSAPRFDEPSFELVCVWSERVDAFAIDHEGVAPGAQIPDHDTIAELGRKFKGRLVSPVRLRVDANTGSVLPTSMSGPSAHAHPVVELSTTPEVGPGVFRAESESTWVSPSPVEHDHSSAMAPHAGRADEAIGMIGPAPVEMNGGGRFAASGVLFFEDIRDKTVLKGSPVILQARAQPGDNNSPLIRVSARIMDASVDQVSTIAKCPTTTAFVDAKFELIREAIPGPNRTEIRTFTPKPMVGYRVRWPSTNDLELLGYPGRGISIGWHDAGASRIQYALPPDVLYRSLFVVGGMGGGKTNFLSALARAIANGSPEIFVGGVRPAVIILDAEGRREYEDLSQEVSAGLRVQVEDAGIPPFCSRDFHYLLIDNGKSTFLLDDVAPQDTSLFPATLPVKSERAWVQGAEIFWRNCRTRGLPVSARQFTAAMAMAQMQLGWNQSIRAALHRAAQDSCWDVFDLVGATPVRTEDLLVPGRVTIVDVSRLEGLDRQRAAGLALLTLLDKAKRSQPQNPCPVLLVIDEATRLVPANYGGMSSKEYSDKMGKWLHDVLHRGRRARYGVLLATQYPDDVLKGLADQPQTKIAFALPPKYDRWMSVNFVKDAGKQLRDSAITGLGLVARTARVDGDPEGVPHPPTFVKFPRVR